MEPMYRWILYFSLAASCLGLAVLVAIIIFDRAYWQGRKR